VSENPFDLLARYYDLEHQAFQDDVPLYLGLAGRVGGPLLEVACGSGRVLLPLAEAGYRVVGLDSSVAMLALARRRLAARPALAARVELIQQDLRSARLARRFKLVICALDSFGLLLERAEQLRALRTLARHLEPDGLLVLDVGNGNARGGEPAEETSLQLLKSDAPSGAPLTKLVLRRTDPAEQLDRLLHLYDEAGADGAVHRTAVELTLRYFTRFELELLLERAGFLIEALFGDYDLSPFGPDSHRLIALAHVRRPPAP
jgi:SAM-dependent methyltransferase